MTAGAGIRAMCVNCILNAKNFRCDHPCLDKDAKIYGNCFNRIECDQLLAMEAHQVIEKVLASGCLALNFSPQGRRIVEVRLRGIVTHLKATQLRRRHGRRHTQ